MGALVVSGLGQLINLAEDLKMVQEVVEAGLPRLWSVSLFPGAFGMSWAADHDLSGLPFLLSQPGSQQGSLFGS